MLVPIQQILIALIPQTLPGPAGRLLRHRLAAPGTTTPKPLVYQVGTSTSTGSAGSSRGAAHLNAHCRGASNKAKSEVCQRGGQGCPPQDGGLLKLPGRLGGGPVRPFPVRQPAKQPSSQQTKSIRTESLNLSEPSLNLALHFKPLRHPPRTLSSPANSSHPAAWSPSQSPSHASAQPGLQGSAPT